MYIYQEFLTAMCVQASISFISVYMYSTSFHCINTMVIMAAASSILDDLEESDAYDRRDLEERRQEAE
jgi:hypothetical protein